MASNKKYARHKAWVKSVAERYTPEEMRELLKQFTTYSETGIYSKSDRTRFTDKDRENISRGRMITVTTYERSRLREYAEGKKVKF